MSCLQLVLFVRPFPCAVCHLCCEPYLIQLLKLCEVSVLDFFFRIGCGTRRRTREKWRGNWRMEWVASTLHTTSEHGVSCITTADAHNSAASSWLNWPPPADLNGLVRFAERRNLVSARVPSHFKRSLLLPGYPLHPPVSPSLPLPCVTVCHHISNAVYYRLLAVATNGRASGIFYSSLPEISVTSF